MVRFSVRALSRTGHVGQVLAETRQRAGISLREAARRLSIPREHLEALEAAAWDLLPAGSYPRLFVRRYAQFLGLTPEPLVAQVPPDHRPQQVTPPRTSLRATTPVHPLRRFLYGLLLVGAVAYLVLAAKTTFLSPPFELLQPARDLTTSTPTVTVAGRTATGVEVTINGVLADVDGTGRFNASVALAAGLNTLEVTARRSLSRPVTITRHVLFTPLPTPPPTTKQPQPSSSP